MKASDEPSAASMSASRRAMNRQIDDLIDTLAHNLTAWPDQMKTDYLSQLHEPASQVGTLAGRLGLSRLNNAAQLFCDMLRSMHGAGHYNKDAAAIAVRSMRLFSASERDAGCEIILTELGRMKRAVSGEAL